MSNLARYNVLQLTEDFFLSHS